MYVCGSEVKHKDGFGAEPSKPDKSFQFKIYGVKYVVSVPPWFSGFLLPHKNMTASELANIKINCP